MEKHWKEVALSKIDESARKLIHLAKEVQQKAYAPYSRYQVGSAIEDVNGNIHTGCNVENASYSISICAERAAIAKMVSTGVTRLKRVAVITLSKSPVFPCGSCLQMLHEMGGNEAVIFAVSANGERVHVSTIQQLFPSAFSKEDLNR